MSHKRQKAVKSTFLCKGKLVLQKSIESYLRENDSRSCAKTSQGAKPKGKKRKQVKITSMCQNKDSLKNNVDVIDLATAESPKCDTKTIENAHPPTMNPKELVELGFNSDIEETSQESQSRSSKDSDSSHENPIELVESLNSNGNSTLDWEERAKDCSARIEAKKVHPSTFL